MLAVYIQMSDTESCDSYGRPVGGRRRRHRRSVAGRGLGERDPMVHLAKGNLAQERAVEGMGSPAQQHRKLHKAAHAHMLGAGYTGGGFLSDLLGQVPVVGGPLSKISSAIGLGHKHHTVAHHRQLAHQARMNEHLGAEIEHLRRGAKGGMVYHGAVPHGVLGMGGEGFDSHIPYGAGRLHHAHGGDFWSDFKSGFNSVVAPIAGAVKHLAPLAGPEGQAVSGALGALGYGATGGRRRRAKAGPSDGRRVRAELVRKVMRERGCSLPEASKIVKNEHMY